jgi:CBS domain-containing protein
MALTQTVAPPRLHGAAVEVAISTIMSRIVISVSPKVTIDRLIRLFVEHDISGAPVVNAQGRPIGMVSKSDIIAAQYEAAELPEDAPLRLRNRHVRDIMSAVSVSVPENTPVPRAAATLWKHHLHRAPVVNEKGAITGLFTSSDILRWLAEQTGSSAPVRLPMRLTSIELVNPWETHGLEQPFVKTQEPS